MSSRPLQVLVAGGGVAGLEALLALRDLAGDRVALTLLSPETEFVYRPMAVTEPFGRGRADHHPLADIAEGEGAELIRDTLAEVDPAGRTAVTGSGRRLSYDALLVAVGAGSEPAFRGVLTWTPETDADLFGGLRSSVVRVDLGRKGVFYRLQAGPLADEAAARALCSRAKQRKLGCIVVRP